MAHPQASHLFLLIRPEPATSFSLNPLLLLPSTLFLSFTHSLSSRRQQRTLRNTGRPDTFLHLSPTGTPHAENSSPTVCHFVWAMWTRPSHLWKHSCAVSSHGQCGFIHRMLTGAVSGSGQCRFVHHTSRCVPLHVGNVNLVHYTPNPVCTISCGQCGFVHYIPNPMCTTFVWAM